MDYVARSEKEAITKITDQAHDFGSGTRTDKAAEAACDSKKGCVAFLKKLLGSKKRPRTCAAYNDHVGILLAQSSIEHFLNPFLDEAWNVRDDRIKITVIGNGGQADASGVFSIPIYNGWLSQSKAKAIVSKKGGFLDMFDEVATANQDPIKIKLEFPVNKKGESTAGTKTVLAERKKMKDINSGEAEGYPSIIDCVPPPKSSEGWPRLNKGNKRYWLSKNLDPATSYKGEKGAEDVGDIKVPFIAYKVGANAKVITVTIIKDVDENITMTFSDPDGVGAPIGAGNLSVQLGQEKLPSSVTDIVIYLNSIINIGREGKTSKRARNTNIFNKLITLFKTGALKTIQKTKNEFATLCKFARVAHLLAQKIWTGAGNEGKRLKFIIAFILHLKTLGDYTNLIDAWKLGRDEGESLLWTCDNFLKFVAFFFDPPEEGGSNLFNIKHYKIMVDKSHRNYNDKFYNMSGGGMCTGDDDAGDDGGADGGAERLFPAGGKITPKDAIDWAIKKVNGKGKSFADAINDIEMWTTLQGDTVFLSAGEGEPPVAFSMFNEFIVVPLEDGDGQGEDGNLANRLKSGRDDFKERIEALVNWRKDEIDPTNPELEDNDHDEPDSELIWRIIAETELFWRLRTGTSSTNKANPWLLYLLGVMPTATTELLQNTLDDIIKDKPSLPPPEEGAGAGEASLRIVGTQIHRSSTPIKKAWVPHTDKQQKVKSKNSMWAESKNSMWAEAKKRRQTKYKKTKERTAALRAAERQHLRGKGEKAAKVRRRRQGTLETAFKEMMEARYDVAGVAAVPPLAVSPVAPDGAFTHGFRKRVSARRPRWHPVFGGDGTKKIRHKHKKSHKSRKKRHKPRKKPRKPRKKRPKRKKRRKSRKKRRKQRKTRRRKKSKKTRRSHKKKRKIRRTR